MKRILLMCAMGLMIQTAAFGQVESSDLGEPGTSTPPPKQEQAQAKEDPPAAEAKKPAESAQKSKPVRSSSGRKVAAFWVIVP